MRASVRYVCSQFEGWLRLDVVCELSRYSSVKGLRTPRLCRGGRTRRVNSLFFVVNCHICLLYARIAYQSINQSINQSIFNFI